VASFFQTSKAVTDSRSMVVMGGSAAGAVAEVMADADGAGGGEGSAEAEGAGEGADAMANGCEVGLSLGGSDFAVQAESRATDGKTNIIDERRYEGGNIGTTVSQAGENAI